VFLRNVPASLAVGDMIDAVIEDADEHDLFGVACE
jgi:ribosomal protein S12 methylthiotransferase